MNKYLKIITIGIFCYFMLTGSSCQDTSTDTKQKLETEKMVKAASQMVGMPNIVNFQERRFAKLIYELKDTEIVTYSYFMDMNGNLHFLCDSVGYGMPASVQYVNPERTISQYRDTGTIPQPEPNGLFMPEGLDATYVLCSDGKGSVKPVYTEPKIIVSPFKLKSQPLR